MSFVLAALVACAPAEGENFPACTLTEADGSEECPIDPCAIGCSTVAEGLACCVATHGRGEPGTVTVDASMYCATSQTYDRSAYLGEDAARCAAQVQGLPGGLGVCPTTLVVCDDRPPEWQVMSLMQRGCGYADYQGQDLDAWSGLRSGMFVQYHDGICEE